MKLPGKWRQTSLVLIFGLTLNGCGKQETNDKTIAKVNGAPISAQQLDLALSRMNVTQQDLTPQTKSKVMQALVDQQLLVQKATEQKLDRDPEVKLLLEAARDQVLSQVYLKRASQAAAKPADGEISAYYNEHPELFSQRRLYNLQELTIRAPSDRIAEIKSRLETSPGLEEFVSWLRSQNLVYRTGSGVKAPEQMPTELAARMQTMQNGQFIALPSREGLTVLQIASTQPAPVSLDKVKTAIEGYLMATKQQETAKVDLEALRNEAKIEFFGEFSNLTQSQDQLDRTNSDIPPVK